MVSWPRWRKSPPPAERDEQPVPELGFTPVARAKLGEILAPDGPNAQAALRVSVKNPGASTPQYDMALDAEGPRPGDTVFDAGGFRVLVDAASLPSLNGASVDFEDDPLRPGFRVDPPLAAASLPADEDELTHQVRLVIERQINPSIAAHGGHVHLLSVEDDVAYVVLGGGCQGCAMASVTLKQGVEQMIRQAVPRIQAVVDRTDHAGGSNPYYQAAKDTAQSPFHQAAKG
jgi:Fe/S biogenesis protein NfuA